MSQAKIYWDLDNYAQVEKVSDCYLFTHETLRSSEARLNVLVRSSSNWNLEVLVFEERGKPEYPEKNLSQQGREPTTNSTHI